MALHSGPRLHGGADRNEPDESRAENLVKEHSRTNIQAPGKETPSGPDPKKPGSNIFDELRSAGSIQGPAFHGYVSPQGSQTQASALKEGKKETGPQESRKQKKQDSKNQDSPNAEKGMAIPRPSSKDKSPSKPKAMTTKKNK